MASTVDPSLLARGFLRCGGLIFAKFSLTHWGRRASACSICWVSACGQAEESGVVRLGGTLLKTPGPQPDAGPGPQSECVDGARPAGFDDDVIAHVGQAL